MAVRESSPGRGKTTYNTPSVFTRLDTLETEVGGIVFPDVTGKADKTYVDSQDGLLSAQLADRVMNLTALTKKLQAGLVTKITLIGDSITEGVGSTGHVSPPPNTQPKIFDDGAGNVFYEGGYTEPSFANYFRNYITANFPSVQFVNKGIAGKSVHWGNANKQYWVGTEDVVFVMLGTNDRWDGTDLNSYKADLTSFLSYVKQHSNLMFVMTATPCLNDFADDAGTQPNPSYHFGMKEVDRVITEVCNENGYFYFSHYRKMLNWAYNTKTPLSTLLQGRTVGSHPIDAGHKYMWFTLQQELGIIDNTMKWDGTQNNFSYGTLNLAFDYSTLATDSRFVYFDMWYVYQIGASDPNIAQYPESAPGLLRMYRGDNIAYVWEEYLVRASKQVYRRYWDYSNNVWSPWTQLITTYNTTFDYSTLATDSRFTSFGVTHYTQIGASDPNISQYPESLPGTLRMIRGDSIAYVWEEYIVRGTSSLYRRGWDFTNNLWTIWTLVTNLKVAVFDYSTSPTDSRFTSWDCTYTCQISTSDPNLSQYPESSAGTLKLYRGDNSAYIWEEYLIRGNGHTYRRYWNGVSWTSWQASGIVNVNSGATVTRLATDSITNWNVGTIEYNEVGASNSTISSFPTSAAGLLITYRGVTDLYSHQHYRLRQSNSIYARYWDTTNSVWTAWTKISAV